ncbi:MAG TPA: methylated-DNA--[protein]-cysteine S-methyltransferase [Acidobacteriota bacterium]|nr:methylated-DNA--[protein]-cysteine S-methyltransferase [Acidobacteriota bacterium]
MNTETRIWKSGDRWFAAEATDEGIVRLDWSRTKTKLLSNFHPGQNGRSSIAQKHLELAQKEVTDYVDGKLKKFTVKVAPTGTPWFVKVWNEMARIPFGKSVTYGDLAKSTGKPKAPRAIGQACGRNPIPIIIPCHRVLASNGKLGGFGYGLDEKRWLLKHEGIGWKE